MTRRSGAGLTGAFPIPTSAPRKDCPLATALAERMRESRHELVEHWLSRITARVSLAPNSVFPSSELLDHVPLLIGGIADYLQNPSAEVGADTPVVAKALELGALRHRQGFDAYEIMKEYELLGGILFHHLAVSVREVNEPCDQREIFVCAQRLFRAISIIQQTTTAQYLRLADEKVSEREDRLRAFNRMLSHEIKNDVGAILGAADVMLTIGELDTAQRNHFAEIIARRARSMKETLDNLVVLSRMENDARQHRHVRLPQAIAEATRQIREAADAARIQVRTSPGIPDVEVNAAVLELALTNYLSNAIKYSAPSARSAFVEIGASEESDANGPCVIVRVKDNGLGVPEEKREQLFERFFRAHDTVTSVEGTGLGLSIVRDMVESVGGHAWAEFPDVGSVFCFSMPLRRTAPADRRKQRMGTASA